MADPLGVGVGVGQGPSILYKKMAAKENYIIMYIFV